MPHPLLDGTTGPQMAAAAERGDVRALGRMLRDVSTRLKTLSLTELAFIDGVTAGTVKASKAMTVDADKKLIWTTTNNSTSNPMQMTNTMTGAGTTGGRMLVELTTNVQLGGWAQAIKAYTNFGASGGVTGMASAINAEMTLGAQTAVFGTYAPVEMELVMDAGSGGLSTLVGFSYMNVNGANVSEFNTNGFLFLLGENITDTNNGLFDANAKSSINMTHALRINIGGTKYFIPIHTSVDFGV